MPRGHGDDARHFPRLGDEGHRITARLAASFLTPAAAAEVGKLLRNDARNNPAYFKSKCPAVLALTSKAKLTKAEEATFLVEGLACVAPWPDPPVKDQRLYTANWHFVDIPVIMQNPGGPQRFTYEPARDCVMDSKRGDCAIQALERLQAILGNQKVPNEKGHEWGEELTSRSEALKFFVHILGDMHQPLHNVADKADVKAVNDPKNMGDVGGNRKYAEWFGDDKTPYGPMNLHSVWDSGFITHTMAVGNLSEDQYYRRLLQELKAGGVRGWRRCRPGTSSLGRASRTTPPSRWCTGSSRPLTRAAALRTRRPGNCPAATGSPTSIIPPTKASLTSS